VLALLAETTAFPLSLQKRVEYLSLAVGNAKSQLPSGTRGDSVQFLTDVEEKLEVAQVQIEIFRAIEESNLDEDEKKVWLEKIEDRLFTVTEVCP
jgi:nuclear pore complex protein Nup155